MPYDFQVHMTFQYSRQCSDCSQREKPWQVCAINYDAVAAQEPTVKAVVDPNYTHGLHQASLQHSSNASSISVHYKMLGSPV